MNVLGIRNAALPAETTRGFRLFAILFALVLHASALIPGSTAFAAGYPARPVRVIVPSAAGGGGDIVARTVGQKMAERWGQQFVVDNRNGLLGPEIAAKADPDGYTLMLTTSALIVREAV